MMAKVMATQEVHNSWTQCPHSRSLTEEASAACLEGTPRARWVGQWVYPGTPGANTSIGPKHDFPKDTHTGPTKVKAVDLLYLGLGILASGSRKLGGTALCAAGPRVLSDPVKP